MDYPWLPSRIPAGPWSTLPPTQAPDTRSGHTATLKVELNPRITLNPRKTHSSLSPPQMLQWFKFTWEPPGLLSLLRQHSMGAATLSRTRRRGFRLLLCHVLIPLRPQNAKGHGDRSSLVHPLSSLRISASPSVKWRYHVPASSHGAQRLN